MSKRITLRERLIGRFGRIVKVMLMSSILNSLGGTLFGAERYDGFIRYVMYAKPGSVSHDRRFPFRCEVSGEMWEIAIQYENYSETVSFDGDQVYYVMNGQIKETGLLAGTGWVSENPFPFNFVAIGKAIWLTYAPKTDIQVGQKFPSIAVQDATNPLAHIHEVGSVSYSEDGGFLSEFELIVSGDLDFEKVENPYLSHQVSAEIVEQVSLRVDKKELAGRLVTRFRVTEQENAFGRTVPQEATTTVYKIDENERSDIFFEMSSTITNYSSVSRSSFVPVIDRQLTLTDYRFSDRNSKVDSIHYVVTNGVWRSRNDAELLRIFNRTKEYSLMNTIDRKSSRGWLVGLGVFAFVSFVVLFFRRHRNLELENR